MLEECVSEFTIERDQFLEELVNTRYLLTMMGNEIKSFN